ncbi:MULTISPECIES: hypothetical protein [Moraxella]|uniref:Uncharacterized protein n=1 Tax=Moraxella lacunata TaxID=477 RepID=A0A1B8Q7B6_MORLA|nr:MULTISPECIES: hypothetical protein [Moraxella]MBE9578958.1 hypothetical protein [Moraxella sp. K1664]MBE9588303.1 hypothetical protein [Moraxella sp. K1630]MBE9596486.1 hypothetical protein [Moraxella sp. K2450]MDH9218874.1 hypothetical protein [Moraxella lacunata]MDI4483106.1 hypothetical protein [Moraxella lacunata]
MKSENQLVTNADKSALLKSIIGNMLNIKKDVYLCFNFDLDNLSHQKIQYDDDDVQVFHANTILDDFDKVAQITQNTDEFIISLFDDFSSYIKMYTDFELAPNRFCYTFVFEPCRYDLLHQEGCMIDSYHYINNAYTVSINTTVQSENDDILDGLAQMLGMEPKKDFKTDEQIREYTNFLK